jgi:hypothetical protein
MIGKVTALYDLVIDWIKAVAAQINRIPLDPELMISDYEIAISWHPLQAEQGFMEIMNQLML